MHLTSLVVGASIMGIKKHASIPLVMPFDERTTKAATSTSGMINMGMQKTETGTMELVRRPGLAIRASRASVAQVAPGSILTHLYGASIMLVFDDTWRVISYTGANPPTLLKTLTSVSANSERAYWTQAIEPGNGTITVFGNRYTGVWYQGGSSTSIFEITDPDLLVSTLTGLAFLDGYTIAGSESHICHSALNDALTWSALDRIAPSSSTKIFYTDLHNNHVVMFGNSSIEFFYNAGNPSGSVLANRRDVSNQTVGLVYRPDNTSPIKGATPIVKLQDEDTYVFIGNTEDRRRGLYMLKDMRVSKISDSTIDNYLMSREDVATYAASPYHLAITSSDGRTLVHLYIVYGTDTVTYDHHVLDLESGIWSKWTCHTGFDPAGVPIILASGFVAYGTSLVKTRQIYQNYIGDIGEVMENSSQFQDTIIDGTAYAYTSTIQTPKFSGDDGDKFKPKSLNRLQVRGAQANDLTVDVSWSDNDYDSYNTPRSLAVENDRALRQCGRFFDRSFKITNAENKELRLSTLELDYEVDE